MRTSESIGKLLEAYLKSADEFDTIARDQVGQVGADRKYKYAGLAGTLDATQPAFRKHGISVFQAVDAETSTLITRAVHVSGEWIEASYPIRFDQSPQACGSALTYARRYSYQALFCLSVEDDDAAAAERTTPKTKKKAPAVTPPDVLRRLGPTISTDQVTRMFTIARKAGWSTEQMKDYLRLQFAIESSKDVPSAKYDAVCAVFAAPPVEQPL